MIRVVISDHVFDDLEIERRTLEPFDAEIVLAPSSDEATLCALLEGGTDAFMVCFAQIGARVVEAAARGGCRVISRYGIGVDNIDVEAATRAGIRVTYVPDYCLDEVADHTLALMLAHLRKVVAASHVVASGEWTIPHGGVRRIAGQRLALIGVGRIGARVCARARAFGIEVVGHDPGIATPIHGLQLVDSAREAVAEADIVSLHLPLLPATRHIVGDELIGAMQRAPLLVNTSRGGLVDLDAAARALEHGSLSGLALDVTDPEPIPRDSPLRHDSRVVLTPHMAFYSAEATRDLQQRATDEVVRALRGEPARSPLNDL